MIRSIFPWSRIRKLYIPGKGDEPGLGGIMVRVLNRATDGNCDPICRPCAPTRRAPDFPRPFFGSIQRSRGRGKSSTRNHAASNVHSSFVILPVSTNFFTTFNNPFTQFFTTFLQGIANVLQPFTTFYIPFFIKCFQPTGGLW